MSIDNLSKLLEDELKDLYSAENQLVKALPKMAKKANASSLKEAFTSHLAETQNHVKRLEQIASELDIKLSGKMCHGMEGLIEEGKEVIEEEGEPSVIDAALIGAAQRVEHYEIAAYGTARAIAETLSQETVVQLLQETLDEEGDADKKLTQISEGEVLSAARKTEDENAAEEEASEAKTSRRRK
jgi:ferritin-like metal-binding protein YciE